MRYTPIDVPIEVLTPVDEWDLSDVDWNEQATNCSPFTYSGECPGPFSKRTTGCYLSSAEVMGKDNARAKMSYEDGKAWCEKYGMHMVAPICETENDESVNMIQTDRAWLGAYNANGSWKSSYTDKPLTYTNWDPPLNSKHAFIDPADGSWKDAASVNESEVVCVKDIGSIDIVNAQPEETYDGACEPPFQRGPYGCYLFSSDEPAIAEVMEHKYDRNDVVALCDAVSSKLATPRNEVENDYFRSKLNLGRPRMNLGAQFNSDDVADRSLYIEQDPRALAFSKFEGGRPQNGVDVSLDRDGGWYGGSTSTPVFMCLAHTDGRFQTSSDVLDTSRFDVFKQSEIVTLSFPSKNRILFDTSTSVFHADVAQTVSFNFFDHSDIDVFGITYVASGITPGVHLPSVYSDARSPRAWDLGGLKMDENGISLKCRSMRTVSPVIDVSSQSSRLDIGLFRPIWGYPWSEHAFTYFGSTNHSSEKQSELMRTHSYVVIDILVYDREKRKNGGVYYRHGYANELNDPSNITWVGGGFRANDTSFFDVSHITADVDNFKLMNMKGDWYDANKHRLTIRGFHDTEWVDTYSEADYDTSRKRASAVKPIYELQTMVNESTTAIEAIRSSMSQLKEYYDLVEAGTYTYFQLIRAQTDAKIVYERIEQSMNLVDTDALKTRYDTIDQDSLSSDLTTMLGDISSSITAFDSRIADDKTTIDTYNQRIQTTDATPEPHNFGVFQKGETMKLAFPEAAEILLSTKTSGSGEKIDLKFTDYPDTDVFGITYITTGLTHSLDMHFGESYGNFAVNDNVDPSCSGNSCAKKSPPGIDLGGLRLAELVLSNNMLMKFEDDSKTYAFFDFPWDPVLTGRYFGNALIPRDQATWGLQFSPKGYKYLQSTSHSSSTQSTLIQGYTYAVIEILVHGGSRERNGGVYYRHGYTNNIDDPTSDEIVYVGGTFHTTDNKYFSRSEILHSKFNADDLASKVFRLANLSHPSWTSGNDAQLPKRKLIVRGFPKLHNWAEPDIKEYTDLQPALDLNIRLNTAKSCLESLPPYLTQIRKFTRDLKWISGQIKKKFDQHPRHEDAWGLFTRAKTALADLRAFYVLGAARKALVNAYKALADVPKMTSTTYYSYDNPDIGTYITFRAYHYSLTVGDEWIELDALVREAYEHMQNIRVQMGMPAFELERDRAGESLDARCDISGCNQFLRQKIKSTYLMDRWFNESEESLTTGSCAYCPTRYYHANPARFGDDNGYTLRLDNGTVHDILGWTPDQVYKHVEVWGPPPAPTKSCTSGWKTYNGKYYCPFHDKYRLGHKAGEECSRIDATLAIPTNLEENTFIDNLFDGEKWIGLLDRHDKGLWMSQLDGSEIQWTNWAAGKPTDDDGGWTIYAYMNGGKWYDSYVSWQYWWNTKPFVCQSRDPR